MSSATWSNLTRHDPIYLFKSKVLKFYIQPIKMENVAIEDFSPIEDSEIIRLIESNVQGMGKCFFAASKSMVSDEVSIKIMNVLSFRAKFMPLLFGEIECFFNSGHYIFFGIVKENKVEFVRIGENRLYRFERSGGVDEFVNYKDFD